MALSRITVFGGSGFIGRALVGHLASQGASVRVAARHPQTAALPEAGEAEAVKADILDPVEVRTAVADAESVVDLVGILTEAKSQSFERLHVDGAAHVAAAAREAGAARLVHVSALGVDRAAPAAADRTKAAGEEAVRAAFPGATIVRPSLVFGPGDHFFTRFAAIIRRTPVLPLIGGGRTRIQPVYIGDVVAGLAALLREPATAGRTYEFGGPRVYTLRELLELVSAAVGRRTRFVSAPFPLAQAGAAVLQWLPGPPLTPDQVRLLKTDKVVGGNGPTLADLGISPSPIEPILPTYLGGRRGR